MGRLSKHTLEMQSISAVERLGHPAHSSPDPDDTGNPPVKL